MSLQARLESPLPAPLPAGTTTALWCAGTCFSADARIERLEIAVDGVRHRPVAWPMPRLDMAQAAYRSGFWGTVPIPARGAPGAIELTAVARLAGGREAVAALGQVQVVERERRSAPAPDAGGPIAICLATHEPPAELLRAQIESLRAQSDENWTCVISDDASSGEGLARINELVEGDPRFTVSPSPRRLGFYRNFERALRLAPPEAALIALCDQDDRWHPEKLSTLRSAIGDAAMAYSDLRLVDAAGTELSPTLYRGRRNNHTNLASLLIANTVTGASMLLRRDVAERAIPFPDTPGLQFHDHWLALVALASGDLAYVDRALYDYVQHPGAVFGDVAREREAGPAPVSGPALGRYERWKGAYFYGYLAREVAAQALLARCAEFLTPAKRRALQRYVSADRTATGLAWLALRPLRRLAGRTETLGTEAELLPGLLWRRSVALRARRPHPGRDASFPAAGPETFELRRLRRWRAKV